MLASPEFEAVWQVIKGWDVDHGGGMRSGATGNDVRAILDALKPLEGKVTTLNELTPKLVQEHANYFVKERAEQVDALVKVGAL
jgi:hypothetical protein